MNRLDLTDSRDRVLPRVLRRQAEQIPDVPFILAGDTTLSYGQVDAEVTAYAAGLRSLGVRKGDTVAVLMESCPQFVMLAFACNRLGAVWVPTNVEYKGRWLQESLADSRARVLVADGALLPRVAEVANRLPFRHVVERGTEQDGSIHAHRLEFAEFVRRGSPPPEVDLGPSDTAAVLWTSGTTGRAKGVMQSHNAWIRAGESGAETSGTRPGDVMYCCLPMHNSGAWAAVIMRALVCGLPFGLDAWFSVQDFWNRTRHYGATQTFTLGAMHVYLWQAPPRPDDADNPVRVAGAVPMPAALREPFKRRFGIEALYEGYGQSEVMTLLTRVDDGTVAWAPDAAGVPAPGIELRLLDDDDREVGVGEVGEFCVRPDEPDVLFNGYFHNPEATLAAYRNLWYHTGDLGRRDGHGQYFFVDRKADYIRYKGRSASSFAIESAVSAHADVAECAAFGVTSAELASEAEVMVAVVRRTGTEVTAEDLARFVNDTSPYFFVPRYIDFLAELPHTPTGRVQKFALRDRGVTATTWDRNATGFEVRR